MRMTISVCPFNSGDFDVIIKDSDTGEEVTLSGHQELNREELEVLTNLAPACVWTKYISENG